MSSEDNSAHGEETTFERLNGIIDQNLENTQYTLKDLCRDLGISRSRMFRLVKEQTNLSPSLYIRQRRLLRAKELLESTDWRIVEVSDRVGLDSPQTFTKYFTQEFGISPTEYRKNQPEEAEGPDQSTPTSQSPRPARSFWATARTHYFILAGIVLLGMVAGGYFVLLGNSSPSASGSFENSVAILPFRSQGTGRPTLLADGLTGQVHSSLAGVKNLKVISRTSSELFRNTQKTIPQMAAELGVEYMLVGTVIEAAGKVRVNVELIEAAEDRTLWADNYEGEGPELLTFMNTVARRVTRELDQSLTDTESRKLDRLPTQNPEAYHEYLLGKQLLLSRTKPKLAAAIRHFDRSIALDSGFADAYARKALAYFIMGSSDFMNLRQGIRLSERNALAAIRLDGENGLAYAILANGYRHLNQWEQAVTTYRIALSHSPNDAQISYWYSITLRSLGRFEEAIQNSNRAIALDPLYQTIIAGHINNYSYAGRYAEADRLFEEYALPLSGFYIYYYVKGYHCLNQNNYRGALGEFMRCDSLAPAIPVVGAAIQFCRARLGQRESAEAHLAALPDDPASYQLRAMVYAGLEDKGNCLKYLRLGAERSTSPFYLKVSPMFRFLHGDPRFDAVLDQLGLLNPVP